MPPKRRGAPAGGEKKKEEEGPKESQLEQLESKRYNCYEIVHAIISYDAIVNDELVNVVKVQEEQLDKLQKAKDAQHQDIEELKATIITLMGFDQKVTALTNKVDAITGVYEDINEKMFEIDKTRKNNLLFYGIRPDFLPEIQTQLEKKVHEVLRFNLNISRNVPIVKIARMMTGPEVRGCRPVLINFAYWKDREEVFSKSKFLRGSNIYITEDLSRRLRESRHRLTQYMRDIRTRSPNKRCVIRYDKLYIDNTAYHYDEETRQVVRWFPAENRPASRNNYSSMGDSVYSSGGRGSASAGMIRSISVPSVNGGFVDDGGFRSDSRGSGINSVMDSQMGSNRADYGSTGNMQLGMQQDEQGGMSPIPFGNEMESPRKPVYNENLGQKIMRNGVEIPTLDTGDDLDRFGSPSPRAPIRTDKEVSPLQLAKKDKSKERQDKLQAEKDEAANEGNLNVSSPKDAGLTNNEQENPGNDDKTMKHDTASTNEVNEKST